MRLTCLSGFPALWEIHCTSTSHRSGRMVFATSLLTFTSRRRLPGLQGFPIRCTAPRPRPRSLHPRGLGLPFRALGGTAGSRSRGCLLSRDSWAPLRRPTIACPLPAASCLRPVANQGARSCSVLAVSHHLDGLLHTLARGLVASHNRPGGSLRSTAARLTPSKVSPSPAAAPCRHGRCPLAVTAARRPWHRSTPAANTEMKPSW